MGRSEFDSGLRIADFGLWMVDLGLPPEGNCDVTPYKIMEPKLL